MNGSRDVLSFGDFTAPKIVRYDKTIDKTQAEKDQENSAHLFEDHYQTNHLVKFLQDSIKSERVVASTGYQFFKEKSLVTFS